MAGREDVGGLPMTIARQGTGGAFPGRSAGAVAGLSGSALAPAAVTQPGNIAVNRG
ncbi:MULTISPECIES: hypothetical protein [unclassified Raoultella]|uniref:hypothetical protein n=1 Tax=unclassified Raoultella TaxID=2627600 RepID=UPI00135907F9|nr:MULTISPECIES: hypothetical protein [unclassified Raoultella]